MTTSNTTSAIFHVDVASHRAGGEGALMASVRALTQALAEIKQAVVRELVQLSSAEKLEQATFQAVASTLRAQLRRHALLVEQLEAVAGEQDRPTDRAEALALARAHRAESRTLAESLRDLGARVRASKQEQELAEHAALLDAGVSGAGGKVLSERAALQSARDVTSSLQRTRQLMADELTRSSCTLRTLDAQGKSLNETLQEHKAVTGTLGVGRRQLSRLHRRDFTDKLLLGLGFLFFLLVVVHVVHRRVGGLFSWGSSPPIEDASTVHVPLQPPAPPLPTLGQPATPAGLIHEAVLAEAADGGPAPAHEEL